jgi:hypothetical protein
MDKKLNRKINLLFGYAIVSTVALLFILFSSFKNSGEQQNADELTVKRLNIVGEDGSLRMVISNETRQHSGRFDGKDLPKRKRPAGIIFFNNDGDECGGLISGVYRSDSVINSGMSFTMDNYRNDQVVQIINNETYKQGKAEIVRGLTFNEYPVGSSLSSYIRQSEELKEIKDPQERKQKAEQLKNAEGARKRLFIGQNINNENGLFLYDSLGNPKIKIYVDREGSARMELVDEDGKSRNIIHN